MTSVRISLLLSFAEKYSVILIQFTASLLLARLLSPAEIGIFSVGAVLISIAHTLRDFGISTYLIQERNLSQAQIRAALGVAFAIGWSIALFLILSADTIAGFYNESGLREVIHVLAINFLLIPFSSVTLALLRREMHFAALYRINTAATVAQSLTGVVLAALGCGFMSLAWGGLMGILATVLLAAWERPAQAVWRPSWRNTRQVLGFGGRSTVASFFYEAGAGAPDLIVGRILGFEAAGYYSRAFGTVSLFSRAIMDAVRPVALPYFAACHRAGDDLGAVYAKSVTYTAAIAWPVLVLVGLLAHPLIRVLYGPQWDAAAPIAQILCLALAARNLISISSALLLSTGHVHPAMLVQIMMESSKVVLLLGLVSYGMHAVALAVSLAEVAGVLLYNRMVAVHLGIPSRRLGHAYRQALLLTAGTAIGPAALLAFTEAETLHAQWLLLLGGGFSAGLGWLACVVLLRHPLWQDLSVFFRKASDVVHSRYMRPGKKPEVTM